MINSSEIAELSSTKCLLLKFCARSILYGFLLLVFLLTQSQAQVSTNITSDGTLGTLVKQNPIKNNVQDIIGGTRPGNGPNLFHSFDQFSVGGGDVANFLNETAAPTDNILGRVTGGNPSHIFGTIQTTDFGNANLFLLNPQGVVFGPTAQLNVKGSFHTSTADFLRFENGQAFFADVSLDGTMTSAVRMPPLQAFGFMGDPVAFGFTGETPAQIDINQSALQVPDGKNLSVVGGDITITGSDAVSAPNGQVTLVSVRSPGEVDMNAPDLNMSSFTQLGEVGIIDSSVNGQAVVIRGDRFVLKNSTVQAISKDGLLDSQNPQTTLEVFTRGDILVGPTTTLDANGAQGGLLHLESSGGTTWVSGALEAKGLSGTGGNVQVLGDRVGLGEGAVVDVSGKAGGGTVLLGGDYQGNNSQVKNSSQTQINPNASIFADAGIEGNGGTIVVWSDGTTRFFGNIRAQGGAQSGDGGLVEVSGKSFLDYRGFTDLTARHGKTGTLLLDPESITISDVPTNSNIPGPPFNPPFKPEEQGPAILTIATLKDALIGANVTVQTVDKETPANEDPGNLTFEAEFDYNGIGDRTLTLIAHNDVIIEGKIHDSDFSGDRLNVTLTADSDLTGQGTARIKNSIDAGGGTINIDGGIVHIEPEGIVSERIMIASKSTGSIASGSVTIEGEKQVMINNTVITTNAEGTGDGGAITITTGQAPESMITLTDTQITATVTDGDGTVHEGGNLITLDTPNLTLNIVDKEDTGFSRGLITETLGLGNGGNIFVNVSGTANILGAELTGGNIPMNLTSRVVGKDSEGQGGKITLSAPELNLQFALIQTATGYSPGAGGLETLPATKSNAGRAGDVILSASEKLTMTTSTINSNSNGPGRGGNVEFKGRDGGFIRELRIAENSQIKTQSLGAGNPVEIDGKPQNEVGAGGNITVNAQTAKLFNSTLTAETQTYGDAGTIVFNVGSLETVDGVSVTTSSTGRNNTFSAPSIQFTDGTAGRILIGGKLVEVEGAAEKQFVTTAAFITLIDTTVTTEATGKTGTPGAITASATNNIDVSRSTISSTVSDGIDNSSNGNDKSAGTITLQANERVLLQNGTTLLSENKEMGEAGDIQLQGTSTSNAVKNGTPLVNEIRLDSNSQISTNSNSTSGGDITLNADFLIHIIDSQISSEIKEGESGGNINLDPQFIVLQGKFQGENPALLTTASLGSGEGGFITLGQPGDFLFIDQSRPLEQFIDVSSQSGQSGTLAVQSTTQNLSEEVPRPDVEIIDPQSFLPVRCAAQSGGSFSSISEAGLDALPPEPGDFFPSPLPFFDASELGRSIGQSPVSLETLRFGFSATREGSDLSSQVALASSLLGCSL